MIPNEVNRERFFKFVCFFANIANNSSNRLMLSAKVLNQVIFRQVFFPAIITYELRNWFYYAVVPC